MLEVWVVCVEQLKLDLVIETLQECILLLVVGVDIIDGVPLQLNKLIQVFIHHHTSLVQVLEFLLLELEGAMGHVVSLEMIIELIPANCLGIELGVAVCLPPVCHGSKQLE
jgi:hypothetical protein